MFLGLVQAWRGRDEGISDVHARLCNEYGQVPGESWGACM